MLYHYPVAFRRFAIFWDLIFAEFEGKTALFAAKMFIVNMHKKPPFWGGFFDGVSSRSEAPKNTVCGTTAIVDRPRDTGQP